MAGLSSDVPERTPSGSAIFAWDCVPHVVKDRLRFSQEHAKKKLRNLRALPAVVGLNWQSVGPERPEGAPEIRNVRLATALLQKTCFSESELNELGVAPCEISVEHCIRAGDFFFKPVAAKTVIRLHRSDYRAPCFEEGIDGKCTACGKSEGEHHGTKRYCHVS